jgi:hypothetical protein
MAMPGVSLAGTSRRNVGTLFCGRGVTLRDTLRASSNHEMKGDVYEVCWQ